MRKNVILIFFIFLSIIIFSQNVTLAKVPKQYSFEMGYRNVFAQSNFENKATQGYGMLLDYAWQLSGLNGLKPAAYITVPMGYTVLMADDVDSKSIHMLNYGWTVRHELTKKSKIVPFLGYGLLLNNMRKTGTEGSLFGHQTQFDFGVNFNTNTRIKYFAKIQYSYTSYPQFNEPERIRLHYADLRVGVRF
jgi:hypothetical protein